MNLFFSNQVPLQLVYVDIKIYTYYFHKKSRRLQIKGTKMINNQKFALPQSMGTIPLYSGKTPLEIAGPI